jgi:lysozyme family protein
MNFEAAKQGYANLWAKMIVRPERVVLAQSIAKRLNGNRRRYEVVASQIGCPWWFIAIVHELEAGGSFNAYLGNGQPLNRVTTLVPRGRGPFASFEEGALDALRVEGVDKITDWSIPRALYMFESYNGFGYAQHNVNSPYVWSFSNLYERGKFTVDHGYSASAVSEQCGAAVILREMIDLGYVSDTAVKIATKETGMSDLQNLLAQFRVIAPTIATGLGGPLAGIIVKAVADQFDTPHDDPSAVVAKINSTPIADVIKKLADAEGAVKQLTPPATPVAAPAPVIVPTATDAAPAAATPPVVMIPDPNAKGSFGPLDGYVTYLGIAITAAGFVLGFMHTVTPEISNSIITVGIAVGGAGLKNAWEKARKMIPFIPALPVSAA